MRRALAAVASGVLLVGCGSGGGSDLEVGDVLTTGRAPSSAGSGDDASAGSGNPPDPATVPEGVTVVEVPDGPVGVTAFGGRPWAALPSTGEVWIDADTQLPVGRLPLRLVATPHGLWVSLIGDAQVARVDVETGEVDLRVRLRPRTAEPEGLAFADGSLWVVDQAGDRVLELDSATGEVRAEHSTGHEPRLVTVGPHGTFVGDYTGGSVTRVADGRATTRNAGSCLSPQGLAEASGLVWVACTVDGQVVALDAVTLRPQAELPDLPYADAVVGDGSTVYVVGQEGPTVWTIDTRTRKVTGELVLGEAAPTNENVGAALVGDLLVVSHPDAGALYEVPLRLLR